MSLSRHGGDGDRTDEGHTGLGSGSGLNDSSGGGGGGWWTDDEFSRLRAVGVSFWIKDNVMYAGSESMAFW